VGRSVDYGLLKLSWLPPSDADYDHVQVLRTRGPKGPASALVYEGTRRTYVDKRFSNGTYYRFEIRAFNQDGVSSKPVRVDVLPSALLKSPLVGAVVKAPPLLRWAPPRLATYYNVQVFYGPQKVLSAWPSRARQQLTRSWSYQGRSIRLRKGTYRWYVWPGFGPRSAARYGQLLGTSTFRIR
jgi:hypothetical protein